MTLQQRFNWGRTLHVFFLWAYLGGMVFWLWISRNEWFGLPLDVDGTVEFINHFGIWYIAAPMAAWATVLPLAMRWIELCPKCKAHFSFRKNAEQQSELDVRPADDHCHRCGHSFID